MTRRFVIILFFFSMCCSAKCTPRTAADKHTLPATGTIELNTSFIRDSLKIDVLKKTTLLISNFKNDSLKINTALKTAYDYLIKGDLEKFKKLNLIALKVSSIKKDTLSYALINENLGYYYQLSYKPDSSFYFYSKALRLHKKANKQKDVGRNYLSLAIIQENIKDYTGSEINSIKAIEILKNNHQYRSLYLAYNNLGVVYNKLSRYNLAIENNLKAIKNLKLAGNTKYLEAISINNIGWVYHKSEKYEESITYYLQALKIKGLLSNRPQTYANLLDNLAYSYFKLEQLNKLPELFFKSLKIRDSLHFKNGQVMSNQHLSEYYLSQSDTLTAINHALTAKKISQESNYNEGLLESYLLLSKLEPGKKGQRHLEKYIKLSDSLQQQERIIREKFTRIAYQTDEIIIEKEIEKKEKWQVILFSIVGASFSILFFIYLRQRSRNKELEHIQEQGKANVEIYNLMLSQQKMFNEGSSKEKKRFSKELHDDILGRLFGTRLSLDAINESNEEKDIANREKSIEELQSIEEDIRKISHDLYSSKFDESMSFQTLILQLLLKQSKITNFEYDVRFSENLNSEKISNTIKINCYRILQESIQNINKYARASNVRILFSEKNGFILFNIEDDGIGFNIKKTKKGIGIKNIKSRVKDLKGNVKFISKTKLGTQIHIKIPITI